MVANQRNNRSVRVLLRLSPEDIRTIRTALLELLQIYGREEGYGAIRQALEELPSDVCLARQEVDEQLQALARACRWVGVLAGV